MHFLNAWLSPCPSCLKPTLAASGEVPTKPLAKFINFTLTRIWVHFGVSSLHPVSSELLHFLNSVLLCCQVVSEAAPTLTADSLFLDGANLVNFRSASAPGTTGGRKLLQATSDGNVAYNFDVRKATLLFSVLSRELVSGIRPATGMSPTTLT